MEYESFEILDTYLSEGKDQRINDLETELAVLRAESDKLAAAFEKCSNTLEVAVEAGLEGFSRNETKEIVANHVQLKMARAALSDWRKVRSKEV